MHWIGEFGACAAVVVIRRYRKSTIDQAGRVIRHAPSEVIGAFSRALHESPGVPVEGLLDTNLGSPIVQRANRPLYFRQTSSVVIRKANLTIGETGRKRALL